MMTTAILSDSEKCRTMWLQLTLFLVVFFDKALGGCPFQNPFWFYDKPVVVNVFDENGEMVANKMRVMWGRLENFRCVDYFQVRILILYVNPDQVMNFKDQHRAYLMVYFRKQRMQCIEVEGL